MSSSALSPEELDALHHLQKMAQGESHYSVLGIPTSTDQDGIQEAFYRLSRKWHPDRFFRRDIGDNALVIEEVFVAITEAYRTLCDSELRLAHDRMLRERQSTEGAAGEAESSGHQTRLNRSKPRRVAEGSRESLRERQAARKRKRAMTRARQLSPSMSRVRNQMVAQLQKARGHYKAGKEAYDAGNMVKASSSLQLAVSYDPQNKTYKDLFDEVKVLAKKSMIETFISAAENAESFQNPREALANYRKAIELGAESAAPYYRLAVMMQVYEDDPRGALEHLRSAAKLAPKNLDYRVALAKLYLDLDQPLSAKRELQYALHVDKSHSEAKKLLKKVR